MAGVRVANAADRIGSVLIYAHHVTITSMGLWGMVQGPSPSVASIIGGEAAATVWSLLFFLFGLCALAARVANRVGLKWHGKRYRLDTTRSEALCIILIGAGYLLFGGMVVWSALHLASDSGAVQTGLALLASSAFLPGAAALSMAQTRRERILRQRQGQGQHHEVLTRVAEEFRRDPGGR
jgi:hypothetical protein